MSFNTKDNVLATCDGSAIKLWRTGDGKKLHTWEAHVNRIAFNSVGDRIAGLGSDGQNLKKRFIVVYATHQLGSLAPFWF